MIINGFNVDIQRKKVKNINLKVYPNLQIKASVPENMEMASIKRMIISKEEWINDRLKKYENQLRITKRRYVSGEDHYLNGKRYILRVVDSNIPSIKIETAKTLVMYVRKASSLENKKRIMNSFYKSQLTIKIDKYLPEIEKIMKVESNGYSIRKMKNKWGSCNHNKKTLVFNVDLAKKTDSEIKFVITHELVHLIEKKHNDNFKKLMDKYCPKWEKYQESLNLLLDSNKER